MRMECAIPMRMDTHLRREPYRTSAPRRPVNLSLNSDLVAKARAEGLNLSSIAEAAVAAALERKALERLRAEIAQGCEVHEQYLAEYGSLSDAVRRQNDADP